MAAVTGAITAIAGIGLSAYQMYQASEDKKSADAAAQQAKQALAHITEQNPYTDVQVPDISSLTFDQLARQEAGAVDALKGMGVEGASQIVNVLQAGKEASLKAGEAQAGLEYQRNMQEAEAQKEINARKAARQGMIAQGELQGAQLASDQAQSNKNAALANVVSGAGDLATGVGQATSLEATAKRNEKKAKSNAALNQNDAAKAVQDNMTGIDSSNIYSSLDAVEGLNQLIKSY